MACSSLVEVDILLDVLVLIDAESLIEYSIESSSLIDVEIDIDVESLSD
ncbi:hypothetical protein L0B62_002307 [Staphylococcus pseudintermedius]|nr:hypothetical protein [Staphylococcus pseudintermedius]